jgi:hypothetical protein
MQSITAKLLLGEPPIGGYPPSNNFKCTQILLRYIQLKGPFGCAIQMACLFFLQLQKI